MKTYLVNFVLYDYDELGFDNFYIFSTYEKAKHCILQMYHYYKQYKVLPAKWASEEKAAEYFDEMQGVEEFAYLYELQVNPTYKPTNI